MTPGMNSSVDCGYDPKTTHGISDNSAYAAAAGWDVAARPFELISITWEVVFGCRFNVLF